MERSLREDLDRAYELAYFLFPDPNKAKAIAVTALTRIEALAQTQDKRRYHRAKRRTRVSMTKVQLFQYLLYFSCETHEREQEESQAKTADKNPLHENDMTVRYLAFLTRICLRRNAFHIAVGMGRLLYAYGTDQVLAIHDRLSQEEDALRSADYLRARKKCLIQELKNRFGDRLQQVRGPKGELRFKARKNSAELCRLVCHGLDLMTPWETCCLGVPDRPEPSTPGRLEAIGFFFSKGRDWNKCEMNRAHALIHPKCFQGLIRSLRLTSPEKMLEVPMLSGSQDDENKTGTNKPDEESSQPLSPAKDHSRFHPPKLDDDERRSLWNQFQLYRQQREAAVPHSARIVIDGMETAEWNLKAGNKLRLSLDQGELLEVVGHKNGEDLLLAACLLPTPEELEPTSPPVHKVIGLPSGPAVELKISALPNHLGMTIEMSCRQSRLVSWLRFWKLPKIRRPLVAFGCLILMALGLNFLIQEVILAPAPPVVRGSSAQEELARIERIFVDLSKTSGGQQPIPNDLLQAAESRNIVHFGHNIRRQLSQRQIHAEAEGSADAILKVAASEQAADTVELTLETADRRLLWTGRFTVFADSKWQAAMIVDDLCTDIKRCNRKEASYPE